MVEATSTNSVDPDKKAPLGDVSSGSTLFVSTLTLTNNETFSGAVTMLAF